MREALWGSDRWIRVDWHRASRMVGSSAGKVARVPVAVIGKSRRKTEKIVRKSVVSGGAHRG